MFVLKSREYKALATASAIQIHRELIQAILGAISTVFGQMWGMTGSNDTCISAQYPDVWRI